MLREKENQVVTDTLPWVLALNSGGEPLGWISYQDCAFYYAKNKVLWSLGQYEVVLRGGMNAKTGKQSTLVMDTIVALDNGTSPTKFRRSAPQLTNATLFHRDRNMCAYCGNLFKRSELTRDHVTPSSKGGRDCWENCVAACKACNQKKEDNTPETANMPLLYVPYTPSYNEHLILQNRKILADQMNFLMKGVSKHSRLHIDLQ